MIRIPCPYCGERDHSEFTYGGDGSITYPPLGAPVKDWLEAVFQRKNIRGVQTETWHHVQGCRLWLFVERDTVTHEIHSVQAAQPRIQELLEDKS